jgi:8-hydroxy-5-deazaflavin:NADPH oxidoreductase
MTIIGFIGSGQMGARVAKLAVDGGYDVVMSNSRDPETLLGLVHDLGQRARAATVAETAQVAEMAFISLPVSAYPAVPARPLAGKTVIDASTYFPERDGPIDELDNGSITSCELLQRHIPQAHVVKAMNSIDSGHLVQLPRAAGSPDRSALPMAGDDASAKAEVAAFLNAIGFDAVDDGTLAEGWRQDPGSPAYGDETGNEYGVFGGKAHPAGASVVRKLIEEADR